MSLSLPTITDARTAGLCATRRILRLRGFLPAEPKKVIRIVRNLVRLPVLRAEESPNEGFNWDFHQLPDDLSGEDREIFAGCISVISGTGVTEALLMTGDLRDLAMQEMSHVLERGFERLSSQGYNRLGSVLGDLRDQMAALQYGTVDPMSIAAFWNGQFTNYKDYEFARLARTEAAFAGLTTKLHALKVEYDAIDEALVAVGAIPPIHPNCLCDIQLMPLGDQIWLYLDTQLEPCIICNDLADEVLAYIEGHIADGGGLTDPEPEGATPVEVGVELEEATTVETGTGLEVDEDDEGEYVPSIEELEDLMDEDELAALVNRIQEDWVETVEEDRETLHAFEEWISGGGYRVVREYQRTGTVSYETLGGLARPTTINDVAEWSALIEAALADGPVVSKQIRIYRGMYNMSEEDIEQLFGEDANGRYRKFTAKATTSVTFDIEEAFSFATGSTVAEGKHAVMIELTGGVIDIRGLAGSFEEEGLVRQGTTYQITDMWKDSQFGKLGTGGYLWQVRMEIVSAPKSKARFEREKDELEIPEQYTPEGRAQRYLEGDSAEDWLTWWREEPNGD